MAYTPPTSATDVLKRYGQGERAFPEAELDATVQDFQDAFLEEISFTPSSFIVANFRGAKLRNADFSSCNVKTCDFRGADLRGAVFRNAAIDGATFEEALLDGADFTGAGCYGVTLGPGEIPDW